MMKACKCGSYAINHNCHGRDGSDDDLCDVCYWRKRAEQPAQQQEPVAWMNPDDLCADTAFRWCKIDEFTKPVYTSPPASKPWVGLTDEQWQSIADTLGCIITRGQKDAIEAKLREKNQ